MTGRGSTWIDGNEQRATSVWLDGFGAARSDLEASEPEPVTRGDQSHGETADRRRDRGLARPPHTLLVGPYDAGLLAAAAESVLGSDSAPRATTVCPERVAGRGGGSRGPR